MSATHEERQGHTAGPWTVETPSKGSLEWEVVKLDGPDEPWRIALCYDGADGASSEANARLIAAAPEMLVALKEARTTLSLTRSNIMTEMKRGRGYQWEGVPELLQQRIDAADAAIAAAEGRS